MARFFRTAIFTMFIACFFHAGNAFAAGGTCPSGANYLNSTGQLASLASLGVTNCYYIAADGSDSNSGTTESSSWAHLPGMSTCTGNCAGHTPAAGEGYIFRGGDTWNGSNLGVNWQWGGTSSNPIYIGVDQSWYSGSSWARPIWTCGGTACAGGGPFFSMNEKVGYNILDNIEMTGLNETTSSHPDYVDGYGTYNTFENIYTHGWVSTLTTNSASQMFGGVSGTGTVLRYNVMDGSDTGQTTMYFTHSGIATAYGNVMRYIVTGLDGCGDNWHDNLFEYMVNGQGHQDGLYQQTQCFKPNSLIYNNVIRHTTWPASGGAVKLWFNGNAPCPFGSAVNACVSYAFNNVVYDNYPGNVIDAGGHFGVNYGTWYIFNNTFDCGTDSTPGSCGLGDNGNGQAQVPLHGTMALYLINNHWISTATSSITGWGGLVGSCAYFTCSEMNGVYQTVAAANAHGYTSTSTYAFEPTSGGGSTVNAGANESSLCNAISGVDSAAGTACRNATGYACAYNSINHTVTCPTRTEVPRPTSAWDVGAYQFSTTQTSASAPEAPQGLAASVQ